MLTRPSFKKSLIVEQFQGNYLKERAGGETVEINNVSIEEQKKSVRQSLSRVDR